jgi:hypothetical protein
VESEEIRKSEVDEVKEQEQKPKKYKFVGYEDPKLFQIRMKRYNGGK